MRGFVNLIESIERELKYLVQKNEFCILKNYLDSCSFPNNTVIQTNYYLDTSDYTLKSKGITLKLREINHQEYYFTMKIKNAEIINNLHIKKEFNFQINQKYFELIKNAKDIRMQLDIFEPIKNVIGYNQEGSAISMIGCLITKRISYKTPDFNDPILLDKNIYLNEVDYEIEWETEKIDSALQKIENIFDSLGITTQVNSISKSKRFMKLQRQLCEQL